MAVDTPAKIVVLGGGPIGLEAGLYARFLGYEVEIFDRGDVAQSVRDWGHVKMFSPFSMNATPLGVAAISAQHTDYQPPDPDDCLTGSEFAERYLIPLAETDLLSGCVREQTNVASVGRSSLLKHESIGNPERAAEKFRVLVRSKDGSESAIEADAVIDSTGTYSNARWLGPAGTPAIGEKELRSEIEYGVVDVLGSHRVNFQDQHTLVVGAGFSAATTMVALAELAEQNPAARVTWLVRRPMSEAGPIPLIDDDPLQYRRELSLAANAITKGGNESFRFVDGCQIEAISKNEDGRFIVRILGETAEEIEADQVIANVGSQPDNSIFSELQVHQCYATEGPMKLAAALMGSDAVNCLEQESHGAESLMTTEPNFYVLGSKSYGRNSQFLLSIGHRQIRDLFTIIGDRPDLDLYSNIKPLNT